MRTYLKLILSVIVLIVGCKPKQNIKTLKLGHGLDVSHPVHKGIVFFAEDLNKRSNGSLIIKIYPNGQLGDERELLELLQIGSLEITKVNAAVLENFVPDYKVLSIPYLFRSREHAYQFYGSELGQSLLTKGESVRLRGLCYYDAGSRSFYTTEKPIYSATDLRGLKIRTQKSNMAIQMIRHFDASPTPIDWSELYTALQQGVVDGAENNLPSFFLSKHYEISPYLTLDEHTRIPDILVIGSSIWNSLSEKEQKWILDSAKASSQIQKKLWTEAENLALSELLKENVEIIEISKDSFVELISPMIDEIKSDSLYAYYINGIEEMLRSENEYAN